MKSIFKKLTLPSIILIIIKAFISDDPYIRVVYRAVFVVRFNFSFIIANISRIDR